MSLSQPDFNYVFLVCVEMFVELLHGTFYFVTIVVTFFSFQTYYNNFSYMFWGLGASDKIIVSEARYLGFKAWLCHSPAG